MAKKKVRAKDLKKQRWAAIVAAILALGMIVSLVGVYLVQAIGGGTPTALPSQQSEPQPEDYLVHYQDEVDRLESYLDEHDATAPVLLELAENYRYLAFIHQFFFEDEDSAEQVNAKLVDLYDSLIDLEPNNTAYRLELVNLYFERGSDESLIIEQARQLSALLEDEPHTRTHLALIEILNMVEDQEFASEELTRLVEYFEENKTLEGTDSEELFYYAVTVGEYLGERSKARDALERIFEIEDDESAIYQQARSYLDMIEEAEESALDNVDDESELDSEELEDEIAEEPVTEDVEE